MSLSVLTELAAVEIKKKKWWDLLDFIEVWHYHELLYFLTWRDIKIKYKQTVFGIAWAILQPFLTMVVFSIFFGRFTKVPSDGIPYPVFVYIGLLPWSFVSSALSRSGNSLIASSNLITKVYFPRVIIPLSASISVLIDFFFASTILVGMMFFYNFIPDIYGIIMVPVLILLTLIVAVGSGLWLSALSVEYRDFQYVIPFLVQIWMFTTPVIYPLTIFPDKYRWILSLNPMGGIIDAFRASILGHQPMNWNLLIISSGIGLLIFFTGLIYFRKAEHSFADVI